MGFKGRSSVSGISLVEALIAMGVASGIAVTIAQMISSTSRTVKSIAMGTDWVGIQANLRILLSDPTQCARIFGGDTFSPPLSGPINATRTLASGPPLFPNVGYLGPMSAPNVLIPPALISTTETINSFRALQIRVYTAPGNTTRVLKLEDPPGTPYDAYLDTVELYVTAQKANADGTPLEGAAQNILETSSAKGNPIRFNIIRKQALSGQVFTCYGVGTGSGTFSTAGMEVCNDLGGAYVAGATPACRLRNLFLGANDNTSAPNASPMTGQRIQFWDQSGPGTQDRRDYAIGIDSWTMWFNAAHNGNGMFRFTNDGGNDELLRITSNSRAAALDGDYGWGVRLNNTRLYVGDQTTSRKMQTDFISVGSWAFGLGPPNDSSASGEKIQLWDNVSPITKDKGDYAIGMDSGTMWFNAGTSTSSKFDFWNRSGGNRLMTIGGGGITIHQSGGNVPHDCGWSQGTVSCTGYNACHIWISCPSGKYPMGGGGLCPEYQSPRVQLSTTHLHNDGWTSWSAWGVTCEAQSGTITGSTTVQVYCCRM